MDPLTNAGLAVSKEVGKLLAKRLLDIPKEKDRRNLELVDLIAVSVPDTYLRRRLARRLEDLTDSVAGRISSFYDAEFGSLSPNERMAALMGVVDTLADSDLSDATLFSADLDAASLARQVRNQMRDDVNRQNRTRDLSSAGVQLFNRVLDDCCLQIVRIVQQLPDMSGRVSAEVLQRLTSLLDGVEQILERMPKTGLGSSDAHIVSSDLERDYLQYVSDTYDELEVFGIDTRHYRPRTFVTAAYVTLTVRPSDDDPAEQSDGRLRSSQLSVEAAISGSRLTLLRGGAGSGKTTLLQWLAVTAARSTFSGPLSTWNGSVPFMVRLRRYASRDLPTLGDLVADLNPILGASVPPRWVDELFLSGRALVLVDGIDELQAKDRRKVNQWLRSLLTSYSRIRIIVTSRLGAVDGQWLKTLGFASAELEPMNPRNIEIFCRRWHNAIEDAHNKGHLVLPISAVELPEYQRSLIKTVNSRKHFRSLATTPLLCAMLCALNLDRRKQLPPDRMKLYMAAVDLLVERRDAEREIPAAVRHVAIPTTVKIEILQQLAWRYSSAGVTELDIDAVREYIVHACGKYPSLANARFDDVATFLIERSGVLREPAVGRVDFIHRTFQEYFAACEAVSEHMLQTLVSHANDDQWSETIIMATGKANFRQQEYILDSILSQAEVGSGEVGVRSRRLLLLAAACAENVSRLDQEIVKRVDESIAPLFPPRDADEARSLAVGSNRSIAMLPDDLLAVDESTAAACVVAAALMDHDGSLNRLAKYAQDGRRRVQDEIRRAWRFFDLELYAKEVLSEAVLCDGKVLVEWVDCLPFLHYIKELRKTEVVLHWGEPIADLSCFVHTPQLRKLIVSTSDPVPMQPIEHHVDLEHLAVTGRGISGQLAGLSKLQKLRQLTVDGTPGSAVLAAISGQLPGLSTLSLRNCMDLEDVSGLPSLVRLEGLQLDRCVAIRKYGPLGECANLRALTLSYARLEKGLETIGRQVLTGLQSLNLYQCVGIHSLKDLAGGQLRRLGIWGPDVYDISPLEALPDLEELTLSGSQVRDYSVLGRLPKLRRVDLRGGNPSIDLTAIGSEGRKIGVRVSSSQQVQVRRDASSRIRIQLN